MSRKVEVHNGRSRTYLLGPRHLKAIEAHRHKEGFTSEAASLRNILDTIAELYGLEPWPPKQKAGDAT